MSRYLGVLACAVILGFAGCGASGDRTKGAATHHPRQVKNGGQPRPSDLPRDARVTGIFETCIALAPCRPVQGYVEVLDSYRRVVARQRVNGRYTFALVPGQYMLLGKELTPCTDKGHACLFNHPATAIAHYVAHVNVEINAP